MSRILLTCILCLGMAAAANADLSEIRTRGVLRIGVKNEHPGSADAHKDPAHHHKRDFEMALGRAFADHLFGSPDQVEFSSRRKPERLQAVADGIVDLGVAMHRIRDTDAAVVFSAPYYETGLACLTRDDTPIAAVGDLAGKVVALVARNEDDLPAWVAEATAGLVPPPRRVSVANFREAATALAAGRIDALVSEAVNIDAFLARHDDALARSALLTHEQVGVAVAAGNHALLQFVNAVLAELERSGELAALREAAGLGAPAE